MTEEKNQKNQEPKENPQTPDYQKLFETEKQRSTDYITRLQYMQADFENLKKRFDRETENTKKYCTEHIITQLLNVVDELELATNAAKDTKEQTLLNGVEMTLKKLKKILEQEGVTPIPCTKDTPFDPQYHNAIVAEERDNVTTCTILEEIRRGYTIKDKVLRPSIVKVTQPKQQKQTKQ